MKISRFAMKLSALIIVLVTFVFTAEAQNRERFGISARAGGVNAVSGQVMVKRGGASEQLLTSQDELNSGDIVTTGRDSQIEVLLNPGTYLRLSEKSEFVLVDTSLDKLLVKLTKGSAIIEATGPDNLDLLIPIVTDQQRMTIVRSGIYRINVSAGVTELLVRKGRVRLGDDPKNIIKSGKKVSLTATAPLTAKLTKLDRDEFDDWSRARGQTLARANERLSARTLNGYLSSDSWSLSGAFGRWGLWTWSPFASCYTFLPFYYGWSSPYGRYYGLYAGFDPYYYPRNYNGPVIVSNPPSTPGGSTGSATGGFGTQPGGGVVGSPSSPRPASQAGPRDPDSGGRSINRIKDPN